MTPNEEKPIEEYKISTPFFPTPPSHQGWIEEAKLFHDTYEELAPSFGYFTREETRKWNPESDNGRLMIAVVEKVLSSLLLSHDQRLVEEIINELESNPNSDGSISPNIPHWIERKKAQLKAKYLIPTKD